MFRLLSPLLKRPGRIGNAGIFRLERNQDRYCPGCASKNRISNQNSSPHYRNDALIAMSSKAIGATVVTLNSSDFETIKSVRNFSYITV